MLLFTKYGQLYWFSQGRSNILKLSQNETIDHISDVISRQDTSQWKVISLSVHCLRFWTFSNVYVSKKLFDIAIIFHKNISQLSNICTFFGVNFNFLVGRSMMCAYFWTGFLLPKIKLKIRICALVDHVIHNTHKYVT